MAFSMTTRGPSPCGLCSLQSQRSSQGPRTLNYAARLHRPAIAPLFQTVRLAAPIRRSLSTNLIARAYGEPEYSELTKMRSEAQAPFRSFRLFAFGGLGAAAGLSTLFASIRLLAALAGAPNGVDPAEGVKDLAIDVSALAVCGAVLKRDQDIKAKQLARIGREETLSNLTVALSTGKRVTLQELRSFARPVIVAGTAQQIEEYMEASQTVRGDLIERGVLAIPVPLTEEWPSLPDVEEGEERWRAEPMYMREWDRWIQEQKYLANLGEDESVYLSLRMDGRVRGSGKGCPPWEKLAVQLPVTTGLWSGIGDGFDGYVGEQ